MKTKIIEFLKSVLLLIVLQTGLSFAQNSQAPVFTTDPEWEEHLEELNGNFYNLLENAKNANIVSNNNGGEDEAGELARWYSFWVNRVNGPNAPSGSFSHIKTAYQSLLTTPICQTQNDKANWHLISETEDH